MPLLARFRLECFDFSLDLSFLKKRPANLNVPFVDVLAAAAVLLTDATPFAFALLDDDATPALKESTSITDGKCPP